VTSINVKRTPENEGTSVGRSWCCRIRLLVGLVALFYLKMDEIMESTDAETLYALFYETVVLPYVEYRTTRNERRSGTRTDWKSAIAASTAAYHFREHLPNQYKKSHKAIVTICPDFALLGDVVNAAKHKVLTKGTPQIDSVDSILEQVVSTEYRDEAGVYTAATKSIEITLKNGTKRELVDVLTTVINMWIAFLQAAGISGKTGPFPHEDRNRIVGRDEARRMDLAMTQGIAARLAFKFQRYNYEKGCPEPVDLSGHKMSFTVYDPAKMKTEVEMRLTSPEGKNYVGSVELDAEENAEYFLLKNKAEQDEYAKKVMARRGKVTLRSDRGDLPGPDSLMVEFSQPSGQPKNEKRV
jgi:hypothetical protein